MPIDPPATRRSFRGARYRSRLAAAWLGLALSGPTVAVATDTSHTTNATDAMIRANARAHFDRGLLLLDSGDLEAAAAEFEAANTLLPTALAAYNAALAQARLGRPLAAVRLLRTAAERDAPVALRDKMATLRRDQAALLGTLLVRVANADGANIDDTELAASGYFRSELRVGQIAEVEAGSIALSILAPGHPPIERTVLITAGKRQELVVVVEPSQTAVERPANPVHAKTVESARPDSRAESDRPSSSPTVGIVTTGLGVATMAVAGAVLWHADRGFAELAPEVDAFNASTGPGGECSRGNNVATCRSHSEELNQRRADLNRERMYGAIGMGIGAAAALTGALLWFNASKVRPSATARAKVELTFAFSGASLLASGSF